MFTTKCQVQNDRTNRQKVSCFCQNLQFRLYFAMKTSIFKLRPLLRFLRLINSFYRRYVSCMYNRSNISNRSNRLNTLQQMMISMDQQITSDQISRSPDQIRSVDHIGSDQVRTLICKITPSQKNSCFSKVMFFKSHVFLKC